MSKHSIYAKDIEKLRKTCDYLILNSSRGTGKSYAVKESVIKRALQKDEEFIYLRRLPSEVKDIDVTDYFADMDIEKLTKNEYDKITVARKRIFLTKTDENDNIVYRKKIGYSVDLMHAHERKSLQYPHVTTVVFEEYSTDGYYLSNEPDKLMNFLSTVFRDRQGFSILVGNKDNIFNPYSKDWELENMRRQETGTVDTYKRDDVIIKVWDIKKVEGKTSLAFGQSAKAIDGNEYTVTSHTNIDLSEMDYIVKHNLYVCVDGETFFMRLIKLVDSTSLFWYVNKSEKQPCDNDRIVSNDFSMSLKTTKNFTGLTKEETYCFSLLDKIAFDSDRTGTDFNNAVKILKRGA